LFGWVSAECAVKMYDVEWKIDLGIVSNLVTVCYSCAHLTNNNIIVGQIVGDGVIAKKKNANWKVGSTYTSRILVSSFACDRD